MLDYVIPLVLLAAVLLAAVLLAAVLYRFIFCFLPQRMIDMGKTWCENLIKDTEENEDDVVLYEDADDRRIARMYNVNLTT